MKTQTGVPEEDFACLSGVRQASGQSSCILLIGPDPTLKTTRAQIFRMAGFGTVCHTGDGAVPEPLLAAVDIVLICRSIEPFQAITIASAIHSSAPDLPIIRLAHTQELRNSEYQLMFSQIVNPSVLVDEVARLVREVASAKA